MFYHAVHQHAGLANRLMAANGGRRWCAVARFPPCSARDPGDDIIHHWESILAGREDTNAETRTSEDIRKLAYEALRIFSKQGGGSVLPDQVSSVFMRVYRDKVQAADKQTFFTMLTRDFGVQRGY